MPEPSVYERVVAEAMAHYFGGLLHSDDPADWMTHARVVCRALATSDEVRAALVGATTTPHGARGATVDAILAALRPEAS